MQSCARVRVERTSVPGVPEGAPDSDRDCKNRVSGDDPSPPPSTHTRHSDDDDTDRDDRERDGVVGKRPSRQRKSDQEPDVADVIDQFAELDHHFLDAVPRILLLENCPGETDERRVLEVGRLESGFVPLPEADDGDCDVDRAEAPTKIHPVNAQHDDEDKPHRQLCILPNFFVDVDNLTPDTLRIIVLRSHDRPFLSAGALFDPTLCAPFQNGV